MSNPGSPRWLELGRRARAARLRANLTQVGMARQVGVASSYIALIENGERRPDPTKLRRIAKVTSSSPDEFMVAAEYVVKGDETEIPSGVADIVRRMVRRGVAERHFAAFEEFAARMMCADGHPIQQATDETDVNNHQSTAKRRGRRMPESQVADD